MTDKMEDYPKKQYGVWLPVWFMEEFKRFVSRKWPVYNHGVLSLEVQLSMKLWMENDGRTAHTHKSTVFVEAENKPNFHAAKAKGKLINLNNSPSSMTTALVTRNNGNGKDSKSEDYSKRPFNEDPIIMNWLNKMGMGDMFTDPQAVYKYTTQQIIDDTQKALADPEFKKEYERGLYNGILARRKLKDTEEYNYALEVKDKKLRPELTMIKKHLQHSNAIGRENIVLYKDLYKAYVLAADKDDKRTFNKKLVQYIDHEYFSDVRSVKSTAYRAEEKFLQL